MAGQEMARRRIRVSGAQWDGSTELRERFPDKAAYVAYCTVADAGRVTVCGGSTGFSGTAAQAKAQQAAEQQREAGR